MAIRYSGDVEIRIRYGGAGYKDQKKRHVYFDPKGKGFYFATIRAPRVRNSAILSEREIGLPETLTQKPRAYGASGPTSEDFDTAAEAFIKWAELHTGELPVELDKHHQIVIHRVFQSPCPVKTRS